MEELPNELKTLIVSFLYETPADFKLTSNLQLVNVNSTSADLRNLRLVNHNFAAIASPFLFKTLRLCGGTNWDHGYTGLLAQDVSGEIYWHTMSDTTKSVEFGRLKEYVGSIIPIAKYFTTLEFGPAYFEDSM